MARSTAGAAPPTVAHQMPSAETVDILLRLLPVLRSLMADDELLLYVEGCTQVRRPPQHLLYGEGVAIDEILLLVDGHVEEVRTHTVAGVQGQHKVRDCGTGAMLGVFDLVHRRRHTTAAKTTSPCLFISIPAAQISRLLYHHPGLRGSLLPVDLTNRLRSIPILAGVDGVSLSYLAQVMREHHAVAGEVLYQAGDEVPYLYLISRGQVRLDREQGGQLWLGTGAEFGFGDEPDAQVDAIYPLDHNATAVCASSLLRLTRHQFFAITGLHVEKTGLALRNLRDRTVQETGLFAQYPPEARSHLLGFMSHYTMPASFLVTQQGEAADSLWLLLPGSGALIHSLGPTGEAQPETRIAGATWFGEGALRERGLAASTVEAEPGSSWLRLHWKDFSAYLDQIGRPEMGEQLRMNYRPPPAKETERRQRFPWLEVGENVLLESRRHWFDLVLKCFPAFVLSLVAVFALTQVGGALENLTDRQQEEAAALATAAPYWPPTSTPTATPAPTTVGTPTAAELLAAAASAGTSTSTPMPTATPVPATPTVAPTSEADVVATATVEAIISAAREAERAAGFARARERLVVWGFFSCLLAAAALWFWGIADYMNDYLVVTNQRVVHQEKVVFFKHNRFIAPLEHIKDIGINRGFWGAQFGYANLEVQTPGTSGNIIFNRAARYNEVDKRIRAARAWRTQQYRSSGKKEIHTALENRLGVAIDLPERVWPQGVEATPLARRDQAARRRRLRAAVASADSADRIVWRQHWLILARNIAGQTLLMLVLLVGALVVLIRGVGEARVTSALASTMILGGLLVLLWLLWVLRDWHLDQYILDKDQVIDIMAKPLGFDLDKKSAQLSDLVDIRFEQRTPLHILFNFGSVFLQTAASDGTFTFANIPDPQMVTETIRRRRDRFQQEAERRKALQRAEEFPDWLEIYTRLQPGRMD